jgi:hypothetical protein
MLGFFVVFFCSRSFFSFNFSNFFFNSRSCSSSVSSASAAAAKRLALTSCSLFCFNQLAL